MRDTARAVVGHPPLLVACLVRTAVVWGGIRTFAMLTPDSDLSGLRPALVIVAAVAAVVLIDAKATRELLYIRNLGLPAAWLVAWSAGLAIVLEAIVRAVW